MTKTFREAFLDEIDALGDPRGLLPEISRETGVSLDQLRKLRSGKSSSTNADDAVKIAHYFGKRISEFIQDKAIDRSIQIAELDARIRELEHRLNGKD